MKSILKMAHNVTCYMRMGICRKKGVVDKDNGELGDIVRPDNLSHGIFKPKWKIALVKCETANLRPSAVHTCIWTKSVKLFYSMWIWLKWAKPTTSARFWTTGVATHAVTLCVLHELNVTELLQPRNLWITQKLSFVSLTCNMCSFHHTMCAL